MIHAAKKQVVELPDRKEISLCEAVTAVIFGAAAIDVFELHRREQVQSFPELCDWYERMASAGEHKLANERKAKERHLLEQLRQAAYDGRVKFRALKNYADHADGLKDIEASYFYYEPSFNWPQNEVSYSYDNSPTIWSCVHLDRDEFASFLEDMDISVRQTPSVERRNEFAGRPPTMNHPTIKQFVLERARNLLDAADHPITQKEVSEQVAKEVAKAFTNGAAPSPKTIRNNPQFRDLWKEQKRPK